MKKASRLVLIILALLFQTHLFAQNILGKPVLDYSSKAPEVLQMQKFIDVPVSYFNGTPNISVPVYTISSKSISIPLTLQYQSGGIKAEQNEGYVGLGWSLSGTGSITRTVRGNEDEGIRYQWKPHKKTQSVPPLVYYIWNSMRDSMAANAHVYGGFYVDGGSYDLDHTTLNTEFTAHNQALYNGNVPSEMGMPYYNLGLSDPEPDLFYFNFGGYSGKFLFNTDKTIIPIPYSQDLKITTYLKVRSDTEYVNGPVADTNFYAQQYFESFKISTPDGKDYYFGETAQSRVETPYDGKPNMFNAWYLTRIVDRTSLDTVYFGYRDNGGIVSAVKSLENIQRFVNPLINPGDGCINNLHLQQKSQYNYLKFLNTITTAKEQVVFYGGLDSIKIFDKSTGVAYRKLQFDYGKFKSGRKKLLGFTEMDTSKTRFFPYTFAYFDSLDYKGPSAQDYWGYYNGAANNNKLMIGYPGCTDSAANRAPAWPAMKLDALIEVNYPTGGKSVFEYEPHSAYTGRKLDNTIAAGDIYSVGQNLNFSLLDNLIGGLRIKSIRSYDPIKNDTLYKRFYYNNFGTSVTSGHLYIPPAFAIDCSSFACNSSYSGDKPTQYMSTHNLYQGSGAGPHVSYRNVTVQEERNGMVNGKIEYEFFDDTNTDSSFYSNAITATTNFSLNHSYDIYPDWQFKRLPENFLAGREKEKRVYDATGQLLEKDSSIYKSKVYTGGLYFNIINAILKKDICSTAIPSTPSGGGITYMGIMIDSSGNVETVDLPRNDGQGRRPLLPANLSYYFFYRNFINKVMVYKSQDITKSFAANGVAMIDTTTYYFENDAHSNPTTTVKSNSKARTLKQQNLFAFDFNDINNGDSTILFMKKAFLNLPIASFNYNNLNIISGAYRSYKLKTRIDSTIILPYEEYSLNTDPAGVSAATLNLGGGYLKTLNLPLSYFTKLVTYNYNSDNTVSHLLKKGSEKTTVLWDYNGLFATAQATNADSADIAYTGFETSNNGGWSVTSPQWVTNSFLTGKRAYSLSQGNITKTGLNGAKAYMVSYWSAAGAVTVNAITATTGISRNGWTYFEHKLPTGTTSITISGSNIIDELRLYPIGALMATVTFDPVLGVTSINSPNNSIEYYEYDGAGKLRFVRDADKNITRVYDYLYTGFGADTAVWRSAGGNTRLKPCPANASYNTNIQQQEQVDINPNSSTYGTLRWADGSVCASCVISDWQNTATAIQCKKDAGNQNTGEQEREQKDLNPCSSTYNQTRWVVIGTNLTACPLPPPPCTGPDKMLINGVCVTGVKIYTASVYVPAMQKWSCTYHYEFLPDCIKGSNYTEYNTSPCAINTGCTPQ